MKLETKSPSIAAAAKPAPKLAERPSSRSPRGAHEQRGEETAHGFRAAENRRAVDECLAAIERPIKALAEQFPRDDWRRVGHAQEYQNL